MIPKGKKDLNEEQYAQGVYFFAIPSSIQSCCAARVYIYICIQGYWPALSM